MAGIVTSTIAASTDVEMTATWCLAGMRLRKLFVGLDIMKAQRMLWVLKVYGLK
jgi:hypothetical protein